MDRIVNVASGRAFLGTAQWGYRALVEPDGSVLVWDPIASYYTRCHSLTPRQVARVRRLAEVAS